MADGADRQDDRPTAVREPRDGRSRPGLAYAGHEASDSGLPPMTGALRPLVDLVAAIKVSVHTKLLAGFLVGVLLLLGMAVLSQVIIGRMSERVGVLMRLQE
jgi:hypothetical protein